MASRSLSPERRTSADVMEEKGIISMESISMYAGPMG
jgi:hypothetical protein